MTRVINENTRFYIDLDLKTRTIIHWDYGQKDVLLQELPNPDQRRIFITKGQYHKLEKTGNI